MTRDEWHEASERFAPMPTSKGKRASAARKKTAASERARKRVARESRGMRNRRLKRFET
jgi:hypothetical protein